MSLDVADPAAETAIKDLRAETIPAAFDGVDAEVYVTGDAAFNRDFNTILNDYTPIVFAFVLGLSFLLLMIAFRSIVVPLKAIVLNLLSVGAAYGLLVLVFQKGVGADLLGVQESPVITAWIPIFLFCILFGLRMDYHVFLLSRIREHYDLTKRNRESVAFGLHATAKIITGAAVIMVAVFWGFASGRLVDMQQMGFGLAVAVLIDATIVRSVLVPASMALLGKWNWYLPRWLEWLPDLRVEGPAEAELPEAAPGAASAGLAGHGFPAGAFGHAPASGHAFHGSLSGHVGQMGHQSASQSQPANTAPAFQADPNVAYTSYPPVEQPGLAYAATVSAPVGEPIPAAPAASPVPKEESKFLKMIAVPFEGRTYMSIAYLLLSLPLGIAYFTFLIVGFAVGLGSLMVVLGVPVLRANHFLGLEIHVAGAPPRRFGSRSVHSRPIYGSGPPDVLLVEVEGAPTAPLDLQRNRIPAGEATDRNRVVRSDDLRRQRSPRPCLQSGHVPVRRCPGGFPWHGGQHDPGSARLHDPGASSDSPRAAPHERRRRSVRPAGPWRGRRRHLIVNQDGHSFVVAWRLSRQASRASSQSSRSRSKTSVSR